MCADFEKHAHDSKKTSSHSRLSSASPFHASANISPVLFSQWPHDAKEWVASLRSHSTKPQLSRWKSTNCTICCAKKRHKGVYWGLSEQMIGDKRQMCSICHNYGRFLFWHCVEVLSVAVYITSDVSWAFISFPQPLVGHTYSKKPPFFFFLSFL